MESSVRTVDFGHVDKRFSQPSGWFADEAPALYWKGAKLTYQDLIDSGETDTNATVILGTLPLGTVLHFLAVRLVTGFNATVALTDAVLEVGISAGDLDGYLAGLADQDSAGGTTGWQDIQADDLGVLLYNSTNKFYGGKILTAAQIIAATMTVTGDTINDLIQGELEIHLLVSNPPKSFVNVAGGT